MIEKLVTKDVDFWQTHFSGHLFLDFAFDNKKSFVEMLVDIGRTA